jgi:antagonist of KipI
MNIRIIKAGVLDTVQDLGRYGWQHLGINRGGAMDTLSAQVANFLVGNEGGEAVFELHFPASSFFFEQPALIALSGGDFSATINGDEVPPLHPIIVSKYSILQFHASAKGARVYLAVQGGLRVEQWLGSYSTHLKAGIGGFKGRPLRQDDEIGFNSFPSLCAVIGKKEFIVLPWKADTTWDREQNGDILVIPGHEYDRLANESKIALGNQAITISGQSDRMGYQLIAPTLVLNDCSDLVSSPVSFGSIQVLPGGQMILLMADHQTTGGYPRIAHVITAFHHKLAQMNPGDSFMLRFIDLPEAERLLFKRNQHLVQLQNACKFRLEEYLETGN